MDNTTFISTTMLFLNNATPTIINSTLDLQLAMDILQKITNVNVVILMFSLGCAASFENIKNYLKTPKQFITATLLQLLGMPLLGFVTATLLKMSVPATLGVIIMTISPGGSYSNVVTYWMDGDISLSVTMTSCSTILSLGTMPMWLFIFSKIMNLEGDFQIPFATVCISLSIATVPVILALAFKYKFPKVATKVAKFGSAIGSLAIVGVLTFMLYNGLLSSPPKGILAASLIVPVEAVGLGYLASILPCLKFGIAARRTVAIETAFQNAPIAFAVAFISFGDRDVNTLLTISIFTMIYGTLLICASVAICAVYQISKHCGVKWVQPKSQEQANANGSVIDASEAYPIDQPNETEPLDNQK